MMHTVVRTYSGSGADELFGVLEQHTAEIETLMRGIQGFVSYTLVRGADGGFSVTTCEDKAGVDESVRQAKAWIAENAASVKASPPAISEGKVILQVR